MDNGSIFPVIKTGETPISSYTSEIVDSYSQYSDAALVVFSRIGGEGFDLPRFASDDSNRHYLELDNNERALLKHIVDSGKFSHIVVLLNGSNYIDLGFLKNGLDGVSADKLDACINIGSPGANGITALGKILNGEVNPSGHTVDLVYTNYKNDPTWQNFGGNFDESMDYYYAPNGVDKTDYHMIEYEENIYMGYRYYETRGKDNESWYQQNVVYPFGYGLSYTTFNAEIVNKANLEIATLGSNKFTVDVKVTNSGNVEGKQVIQVYAEAPYINGGIEKPYKVLVGFGKTGLLGKGKSETIKIEIDPYYFASFDNHDKNSDGFKGFTLDSGEYRFHVATDSHNDIDIFTKNLPSTINFDKDPITNTKVTPLFDDVTNGMKSNLSRTDWNNTFPTTATIADRTLTTSLSKKLSSIDSNNDASFDDKEMPLMDVSGDQIITTYDLRGVAYNDEKWDAFLNQLSFQDMLDLFNKGCYSTCTIRKEVNGSYAILACGTTSFDGPTGIVAFLGDPAIYGTCYYCSECLVAQTYNLELAAKQAEAIGEEALIGDEKTGVSYSGWYAPRVNLHRSPFSGRNTECYSEDPFLTGRFAATVIDGVQKKGVYANVKNFALNDQETNRSARGLATWVDEQAMRELYLRPFEMAVKEGKSKGLMTSFNRIGTTWTGGDSRLLTKILREEWGFIGSVISDFHTSSNSYMDSKQMLYAGGDLNLAAQEQAYLQEGSGDGEVSSTNKKDVILLRNASHNLLYCIANSNAYKTK
ncbi:MAG: glycoside hydrolase family 3 C-terminal domain-containing protein [Bacilli bacterium]|nr:glycoside hydrolase family 3 C-terminal domain-containing protein [Bacilli bacterium]